VSEQPPDAGTPTGPTADARTDGRTDARTADSRPTLRTVHRAPKYGAFLLTGAVVGVIVAVISGAIGTGDGSIGTGRLIGYLAVLFGLLGALLGGAVAVVIERFSRPPQR
jgi:hypothetical protein